MLTSDSKRKLLEAAMFGTPIALVLAVANMLSGPTEAEAGGAPVPAAVTAVDFAVASIELELSDAQQAARDHVATLRDRTFGPTPLYHGGDAQVVVIDQGKGPRRASPVPSFTVGAILASSSGNTALIGGKAYRVGDAFGTSEWIVARIDADDRSVMLHDPATERVTIGYVDKR